MSAPVFIEETNLSRTWLKVLQKIVESPKSEVAPLLVSITGFEESPFVREKLNNFLKEEKEYEVETVAETIFPYSLYRFVGEDRKKLYNIYMNNNFERLRVIDSNNRKGTYFQRLIAFGHLETTPSINQLEIIIDTLIKNTNKRRSKLQAGIFAPTLDHSDQPYQGFPCLQQLTFYKSESGGLVINSFYAIQHIIKKAYGNWLGLIELGKFIANETDLELERFNCFVGVEALDPGQNISKKKVKDLLNDCFADQILLSENQCLI